MYIIYHTFICVFGVHAYRYNIKKHFFLIILRVPIKRHVYSKTYTLDIILKTHGNEKFSLLLIRDR